MSAITCRMRPSDALLERLGRTGPRAPISRIGQALDALTAVDALERVIGEGLSATGGDLRATAEFVFRKLREHQR